MRNPFHRHRPIPSLDVAEVHETISVVWRWCRCGAVTNGHWGWQHAESRETILERVNDHGYTIPVQFAPELMPGFRGDPRLRLPR